MEAICSSETSVDVQRTTRRYIAADSTLHNDRCENLKSDMAVLLSLLKSVPKFFTIPEQKISNNREGNLLTVYSPVVTIRTTQFNAPTALTGWAW
jgi:hypothetical protein